jgi:hypothetical protein
VAARIITREEAEALRAALIERGELRFPLGSLVSGSLCGTIYGIKRRSTPYVPKFRTRLLAKVSDGFASVLAFALWIGPENVDVWSSPDSKNGKLGKTQFHMRLKPNRALKCAPSGPDAAALRRLT